MAFNPPNTIGTTVEVSEIESLTLGALIVGDGSGAPSTLSAGSNGAFLQYLSSEATGLIARVSPQLVDSIDWTTGVAIDSTAYQILRSTGAAIDRLTINAPQTAQIALAINGQAQMLISETSVDFQNNIVTCDGPFYGSLVYLGTQTSDPTGVAAKGIVYTKNVSSITELHFVDSGGSVVQITSNGSLNGGEVFWGDDVNASWGNTAASPDFTIDWETADADAHYVNFAVSSVSRNIIVSEDRSIDWTHAASTNPTLWIQSSDSATVADYVNIFHDQTDGNIGVGAGDLILTIAGGNLRPSTNDAWALGVSGTAVSDIFLASGAVINYSAADVTWTHSAGTITFSGDLVGNNAASGRFSGDAAATATVSTYNPNKADTDTGIGSAAADQLSLIAGGVEIIRLTEALTGATTILVTQQVGTSGVPSLATLTGGAHTGITAVTESTGILFDFSATKTWVAGAGPLASQREVRFSAPTYNGDVAGALTITNAATVYISGAPVQGTNMTLSNTHALWVDAGNVRFDGTLNSTGGGALTGTWSDLGIVTTVDLNGGTIDGTTVGISVAAAGGFTALVATSLDLNGALDLDVAALGATITNTADAASSQVMILEGDRATMVENDEAYLSMRLSNDAGTQTEIARLTWVATDVNAATSVDGRIDFAVMTAGSLVDELQLDGTALSPSVDAGLALGTTLLGYTALYLSSSAATQIDILAENQGAGNNTAGRPLLIAAGAAGSSTTGAAGGALYLEGGNAGGSNANNGGNINLTCGTATGAGQAGVVNINQPGGTPGTDAMGMTHNGTDGVFINLDLTGDITFGIGAENTSFSVSAESVILANDVLIRRDVNAGIVASTTQTQGNGALTAEVNEVATVANVNDTVTLPTAVAGLKIVIINNGANTLRIFPASGDNLGAGADTATTLAAGSNVVYQSYNATNWESI